MSNYALLGEIRRLLKGNLERNQATANAVFASIIESLLAGIDATVDIVEITSSSYTATVRNSAILADTTLNNIDIYLPAASTYIDTNAGTAKLLYIKKADAGSNSVTIHAFAGDTIEGNATYDLTEPLQGICLISDGNDYLILNTINTPGGGGGGSGDVVGPASAVDNRVARFNGTTGKLIQNSVVTIDDSGNITGVGTVDGRDLATDGTKLDGIESGADVTDATNVAAAGAVMESDYTPAHSLLVQQSGTGSPSSLSVANNTLLGRLAGGGSNIAALTTAQVKTLLAIDASEVAFTPDGDIAATTAQTAIVEVRDDTDTKLGAKVDLAGQLGGTVASPDVRGLRETSGPTLLTLGSVADGEYLRRSGTSIIGGTPSGGGGFPTIESFESFSAGAGAGDQDYYLASSDLLNVGTFTLSALVRVYGNTGTQYIAGSSDTTGLAFHLRLASETIQFQTLDTAGASFLVDRFDPTFLQARWVLISGVKVTFGADWATRLMINGAQLAENYQVANGGARATANFAIGASQDGLAGPASGLRIAWVSLSYRAIQNDEMKRWWDELVEADGVYQAPPGGAADHAWILSGTPGSTLVDAIGSEDLTRTGSAATLTGVTHKFTT